MKEIPLTQSKTAIVDDDDFENINQYKWYVAKHTDTRFYAVRMFGHGVKKRRRVYLHHFILGKPDKGLVIDHINRNSLDNRKENLRIVTQRLNSVNWDRPRKSKYYGVTWCKQHNRWKARARTENGKEKHLGFFKDDKEAHKAYLRFTGSVGLCVTF